MIPEHIADIEEQYRAGHYPMPLCKDIEDLRVQLDSLIKEVDYEDDQDAWKQLVQAKDSMGLAILNLQS